MTVRKHRYLRLDPESVGLEFLYLREGRNRKKAKFTVIAENLWAVRVGTPVCLSDRKFLKQTAESFPSHKVIPSTRQAAPAGFCRGWWQGIIGLYTIWLGFHSPPGAAQKQPGWVTNAPYLALKGTEASCGLAAAVLLGKDGLPANSFPACSAQPFSAWTNLHRILEESQKKWSFCTHLELHIHQSQQKLPNQDHD